MKIREGFVSNSSTSSFVCSVCDEDVVGMDLSIYEAEMFECENGHYFCWSHLPKGMDEDKVLGETVRTTMLEKWDNDPKWFDGRVDWEDNPITREWIEKADVDEIREQFKDWAYDSYYDISEKYCPVCQFQVELPNMELFKYMLKKYGVTSEEVYTEIKEKFGTYREFSKYAYED